MVRYGEGKLGRSLVDTLQPLPNAAHCLSYVSVYVILQPFPGVLLPVFEKAAAGATPFSGISLLARSLVHCGVLDSCLFLLYFFASNNNNNNASNNNHQTTLNGTIALLLLGPIHALMLIRIFRRCSSSCCRLL